MVMLSAALNAQQPFSVAFELQGERAHHNLTKTYDGGYVFCADAELQPPMDNNFGYLVKIDSTGSQEWVQTYRKSNWSAGITDGNTVVQTHDSGFAVATMWFHRDSVTMDYTSSARLIKTDAQGNVLWSMLYPGLRYSLFYDAEETSDHGFIACGRTADPNGTYREGFIVRTDSVGNLMWTRTFGWNEHVELNTIIEASTGDFVAGGRLGYDGILLKVSSSGVLLWCNRCPNSASQTDIHETSIGAFITCGINTGYIFTSLYQFDAFGTAMWARAYLAGSSFVATQMVPVAGGYTMICDLANTGHIAMGRIDLNGNPIWARAYLDLNGGMEPSIVRSNDGGYMFITSRNDGTTATDISIVITKTDSLGAAFCNDSILSDTFINVTPGLATSITIGIADSSIVLTTVATSTTLNPGAICVMTTQQNVERETELLRVFPNPTQDIITVATPISGNGQTRIRLCDVTGRTVLDEQLRSDQHKIDMSALNPGLYFLLLERNGVLIAQKPVIRN